MTDRPAREVLLGLGGNMGDRLAELQAGLDELAGRDGIEPVGVSRLWETDYVGPGRQDPYLNACIALRTSFSLRGLLEILQDVERTRGRERDGHMKPRPIDLDILLDGDAVVDEPGLRVPHPRFAERAFVLEPLSELAPEQRDPDSGETVRALCEKMRGADGPEVRPYRNGVLRFGAADDR